MIFPKGNSSHHLERMGEFLQSVVKFISAGLPSSIPQHGTSFYLFPISQTLSTGPFPDVGAWFQRHGFLLATRENALENRGHLFEPQASCVPCSPPLAFFRELRGTVSGIHQHPGQETVLRVPGATMTQHPIKQKKTAAPPRSPQKEIMFGTAVFRLTPREH